MPGTIVGECRGWQKGESQLHLHWPPLPPQDRDTIRKMAAARLRHFRRRQKTQVGRDLKMSARIQPENSEASPVWAEQGAGQQTPPGSRGGPGRGEALAQSELGTHVIGTLITIIRSRPARPAAAQLANCRGRTRRTLAVSALACHLLMGTLEVLCKYQPRPQSRTAQAAGWHRLPLPSLQRGPGWTLLSRTESEARCPTEATSRIRMGDMRPRGPASAPPQS